MLVEKTVKDFILTTASKSPVPGGGSVSALGGSLGAALTCMVGNLTFTKKAFNELDDSIKSKMQENFNEMEALLNRLNELIDEDTKAFDGVMEAFKLPKNTDEEKKIRSSKIQEETKKAMLVPLETAKKSLEVLKLQKLFAEYGNKNAISDVGVGALMAYSGLEGAILNVIINLGGLKDSEYVNKIKNDCDKILEEGKKLKEETIKIVYDKLGY